MTKAIKLSLTSFCFYILLGNFKIMEELTVTFKNGKELKISTQIANILRDRIIEGGNKPFQCFTDENKNTHCIINVSEIVCVE